MNSEQILVRMVLNSWNKYLEELDLFFNSLSDEEFELEICPGRNRVSYIFGHLTAINDDMIPTLGFGEAMYPALIAEFLATPDNAGIENFSADDLRQCWENINQVLSSRFAELPVTEWFSRHTKVLQADFEKEPHRNKLNIVMTRTNHMIYHLGQLMLLKKAVKE